MRSSVSAFSIVVLLAVASARAADSPKLDLKDGDRVVYLGNTFVERDQSYGYLETLLTIAHPDVSFTFRNLGWSGDTVWGDAHARFGTRADGFKHLKDHVFALKPTAILVAYGMNESFAGEAGLKEFEAGLNTLLDTLAETQARIVLISPIRHEDLGPPLPAPAKHNADLKLYRDAMARVAASRALPFVDLLGLPPGDGSAARANLTDDGLHLTPRGYAVVSESLARLLGTDLEDRELHFDGTGGLKSSRGWDVSNLVKSDEGRKFEAVARMLPAPPWPGAQPAGHEGASARGGGFLLDVEGLGAGDYALKIDGATVLRFHKGDGLTQQAVTSGPEIDQVEKLRAVINAKNELYFHRWRPQNETYLFGFRKHEQGNNSVEIPQFDPLVAEKEAEIARLKKPVKHTYELICEEAGK